MFQHRRRQAIINNISSLLTEIKTVPLFRYIQEHPVIYILVFSSILRFWGIWHGYPFSYYPDEQHFVNRALSMGSGDLNPHWFHKPAFLMYILLFEYGLFFVIGKLLGVFSSVDGFAIYYFQNSWPFVLIGRVTITLFGIGTIYVIYKIGERFWSKAVGLYCSFFLALSFGHIFCGKDVKADVPTTFFTVLSIYFLLKVVHKKTFSAKDYILAGLFAGLGTATKYYSIALLPCILLVSFYEIINKRDILLVKKYLYSVFAFFGIYFVVSPYNFLDPMGRRFAFEDSIRLYNKISPFKVTAYSQLEGTEDFLAANLEGHYLINSFLNYIKILLSTEGMGIIIGVICVLSIFYTFYKLNVKVLVLLLFPIMFSTISIVMSPSYTEPRHQLIIYPFLTIAAGIFICDLLKIFKCRSRILIIVFLLPFIFPVVSIIKNNVFTSKSDTRTLAKKWIESNIPINTKILLDESAVMLNQNTKNLQEYIRKSRQIEKTQFTTHLEKYYSYQIQALPDITYDIREIRHTWWRNKEISDGESEAITEYDKDMANPIKKVGVNEYGFYKKNGYEYVVTSSDIYVAYRKPFSEKSINFPSYKRFYDNLFSQAEVVKEFNHKELGVPGPTVVIFRL